MRKAFRLYWRLPQGLGFICDADTRKEAILLAKEYYLKKDFAIEIYGPGSHEMYNPTVPYRFINGVKYQPLARKIA